MCVTAAPYFASLHAILFHSLGIDDENLIHYHKRIQRLLTNVKRRVAKAVSSWQLYYNHE
jgi:hypothetical protein